MDSNIKLNLFKKQLTICKYVIDFCEANNLRVSLAYGTLLGSIRHNGFIPWDHDIDLMMPRNDYITFCKLWNNGNESYFLQNYDTDNEYPLIFSKVRDSSTTFIEYMYQNQKMNHGVFVDIFPCDNVPTSNYKIKLLKFLNDTLLHITCSRLYTSNTTKRFIRKTIHFLFDNKPIRTLINHWISMLNDTKSNKYIDLALGSKSKEASFIYDNLFTNITNHPFEEHNFPITNKYDEYLSKFYGDYMTPPSKQDILSEEEGLNKAIIDPFKPYIDYMESEKVHE